MNRSHFATCLLAALFTCATPPTARAGDLRVALVDFDRLQRDYFRTRLERESFEKRQEEERVRVDTRRGKLDELIAAQTKAGRELKDPTLSPGRRQNVLREAQGRATEIQSLQREIIELENRTNSSLATAAQRIQQDLTQDIVKAIHEFAENRELDLVLNRTFGINGVPILAYSSTRILEDCTDAIRILLNRNAPKGWIPLPETQDPPE